MLSQTGNSRKIIAIAALAAIGIAVVVSLILLASGSSTDPDESDSVVGNTSDLENLSNQLYELESRINSLATETAALQLPPPTSVLQSRQTTATAVPTNTAVFRENSPRPDPTATSTPLPAIATTGPGICGRSPLVQLVLIDRLKISSCQLITGHELFRVLELPDLQFDRSPQPGDFADLVNVKNLRVQIRNGADLPSDTFHGLEGLESLEVGLSGTSENDGTENSDGGIEPGAFRGLSSIRTLVLSLNRTTQEPIRLPPLEHMETLESLQIRIPKYLFAPAEQHFQHLPELRNLSITMASYEEGVPRYLRLTQKVFKNNVKLEEIQIQVDSDRRVVFADKDTFEVLDALESLSLSIWGEIEVSLSPNSPLFKDILNGNRDPQGYTVLPPGAD